MYNAAISFEIDRYNLKLRPLKSFWTVFGVLISKFWEKNSVMSTIFGFFPELLCSHFPILELTPSNFSKLSELPPLWTRTFRLSVSNRIQSKLLIMIMLFRFVIILRYFLLSLIRYTYFTVRKRETYFPFKLTNRCSLETLEFVKLLFNL